MRERNLPPTRKSFSERGVCQSSEGLHHLIMCSGFAKYSHTFSAGALTVVSTVMTVFALFLIFIVMGFCFVTQTSHSF
jgi:hypothetical protein